MQFDTATSPHLHSTNSVTRAMGEVLLALVPGIAAYYLVFGWSILIKLVLGVGAALICEAIMLWLRRRPLKPFLTDLSAILTATLLVLALPPLSPWWLTVVGIAFAIVIAKHLYGGLGYNPFNPAMVGFVVLIISFPLEMTTWMPPEVLANFELDLADTLRVIFLGQLPDGIAYDALSMATPLDTLKTQLSLDKTVSEILQMPVFGNLGGRGWEWVYFAYLAGGLFLIWRKAIAWQIPAGLLVGLLLPAAIIHFIHPEQTLPPLAHFFSGATVLGAFFIATDPVTASTTPRGRLLFGAGVGLITFLIRTWGGFPDGIAFGVLLMNMAAPTIDYYTQPRVFGTGRKAQ
ncbi:MAG: electron transport complex subunit RsxD [Gammaproteobacteria bacterium]